ncbi:fungal hydrophobin-domain-containing protein [Daedaleopsis nitida]|nr:fungal hydrophobin-domain-containing protein [Daedaleopsis nitida]
MFSRVIAISALALSMSSILAVAIPNPSAAGLLPGLGGPASTTISVAPQPTSGSQGSCSTGPLQCCNQVQSATDPATSALLGLLGVVVQGVDVLVGLDCSPINAIGVGSGNSCNANVVCCQNNSVGGLVSVGCLPVSL